MLYDLEKCNTKTGVFQINSCCPSLADDISCISTSPLSLQRMLDVCNQYSCKWRFSFNAKKSSIVQFSVNSREINLNYSWNIGSDLIPSSCTYSHLGILLNSRFKSIDRTTSACRKGKNAYCAPKGISCKNTHPCALLRLYKSVVLPTVLYGCEMWTNLKSMDIQALNKFQHFIIKHILDLKTVTRSDMCQSILGVYPILSYIDQRKLYFLQKMCSLSNVYQTKKIFLYRLFSYLIDTERKQYGFIPDIMNILFQYKLSEYILDFVLEGFFPSKQVWKNIVILAVQEHQRSEWLIRISNDTDFIRFRNIHNEVEVARFWTKSSSAVEIRNSYMITKLITEIPNNAQSICEICNREYLDFYRHVCCNCTCRLWLEEALWVIITENFDLDVFLELSVCDEEELYQILLGRLPETEMTSVDYKQFMMLCHTYIVQCLAQYNRALRCASS